MQLILFKASTAYMRCVCRKVCKIVSLPVSKHHLKRSYPRTGQFHESWNVRSTGYPFRQTCDVLCIVHGVLHDGIVYPKLSCFPVCGRGCESEEGLGEVILCARPLLGCDWLSLDLILRRFHVNCSLHRRATMRITETALWRQFSDIRVADEVGLFQACED